MGSEGYCGVPRRPGSDAVADRKEPNDTALHSLDSPAVQPLRCAGGETGFTSGCVLAAGIGIGGNGAVSSAAR